MRPYIFILSFLLQTITVCFAQQKSDVFIITTKENPDKGISVYYKDMDTDKFKGTPSFKYSVPSDEATFITFPTREEVNRIERAVFSDKELKNLKRGFVTCIVHIPSGKIVAVSFSTFNKDIDIKKLELYNKRIKNELKFDVKLNVELIKEGYFGKGFPVFTSLKEQKK
ncbi:hypothetical protein [Limibacterium fermenti]|jgi:hypothetical protein|uniref:hypothetical protein n=1 Tax=Limibacterium fermenti TaxID=3229863 RepID=UPI003A6FF853